MKKTTTLKLKDVRRDWYVIDCSGQTLGRIASKVVRIITGKNKPNYAPNLNNGDKVILINTSNIRWTGNKGETKIYRSHSGYQGGLKERTLEWLMHKNPNAVLRNAIYGMLPKNRMRDKYITNVYFYTDSNHNHEAQHPKVLDI
jgi:large subunit ribosomal protein L13